MKYLSVKFICHFESPGQLSAYKGSMLRGVLGKHLRRAVCLSPRSECGHCLVGEACLFPRLFTAPAASDNSGAAPTLTPPFCLEPELDKKTFYQTGESFSFTLKLFSYAVDYLPYFVHAFTLAGRNGLGRGSDSGAGRFQITDIFQGDVSIYDDREQKLRGTVFEELACPSLRPAAEAGTVELKLKTPLRFKAGNHLAAKMDFPQLMRLILRRLKSLWALEGQSFQLTEEEFASLTEAAATVTIKENALYWQDWSRYSGRQKVVMSLGGLSGRIIYQGQVEAFREYLNLASLVHIGKQTSFGLGALCFSY